LVWRDIQHTTSLAVLDDFLRRFGDAPIYGPLARARREEVAKELAKGQQAAVVTPPSPPLQPPASLRPGTTFWDCADCPEMVVVPAGSFTMGSPASEKERESDEGPQHVVTIPRPFAVGKFHVTVDQFAAFVRETGYAASTTCIKYPSWNRDGSWRDPGFAQEGSHPVVCVSWDDANAYVNWLAKKTSKPYRLPSEAEWEYAARAGTRTPFWWGSSITPAQANYDGNYVYAGGGSKGIYRNGTVPVSSFAANPWGLYNVHGNAWQWTADCYHDSYTGAPADGTPLTTINCSSGHVVRGGSWVSYPRTLRAALRLGNTAEYDYSGFRLARTL
jgi:formylglycine-generating enzyme required for sulfatase activity